MRRRASTDVGVTQYRAQRSLQLKGLSAREIRTMSRYGMGWVMKADELILKSEEGEAKFCGVGAGS